MRFLVVLLCLVCALSAAEWRLESVDGRVAVQPLDLRALAAVSALRVEAARDPVDESDVWVEVRLVTADGRRFAQASPLRLSAGERRAEMVVGFDAGSWAGQDGVISADALQAMAACEVAVHGWNGRVSARLSTLATPVGSPAFTVVALQSGLVAPGAEKAAAYGRHVYGIFVEASAELTKVLEGKAAEGQKAMTQVMDNMAKNAPAGTESAMAVLKSALTSSQNAIDSAQAAAKKAMALAESSVATVTEQALSAAAAVSKKA